MPSLLQQPDHKRDVLKAVHVSDQTGSVFLEPSPDGALALAFFDPVDVGQGHGYWRSRFAVIDAKRRLVREFGRRITISEAGVCAWSPDSKHAAVAVPGGVLVWRKGKFAAVRVLSWGKSPALAFGSPESLEVRNFEWVQVRRGGADPGGEKTGTARIGLDQLQFYQESLLGSLEYLLNMQPILTPELFSR